MSDRTAPLAVSRREFYSALSTVFGSIFLAFIAVVLIRQPVFDAIVVLQLLVCDFCYMIKSWRSRSEEPIGSRA